MIPALCRINLCYQFLCFLIKVYMSNRYYAKHIFIELPYILKSKLKTYILMRKTKLRIGCLNQEHIRSD